MATTKVNTNQVTDPLFNSSMARQAIINGNFDVWQRGTSLALTVAATKQYTADRWNYSGAYTGTATVSRQDGTGVAGSIYSCRVQRTAGQTNTGASFFSYGIETQDSIKFVGKKVTLSFWAKCGANYSPTSSILVSTLATGTGTDENYTNVTGYAPTNQNNTLTTSWQKFTLTTTDVLAGTVKQLFVAFSETPTGTAGANDWFEITQVQLCAGDVALPFMPKSFEEELRACQRYYEKSYEYGTAPGTSVSVNDGNGTQLVHGSANGGCSIRYEIEKRTNNTPTIYDQVGTPGKVSGFTGSSMVNGQTLAILAGNTKGFYWINTTASTTLTYFNWTVSAEL